MTAQEQLRLTLSSAEIASDRKFRLIEEFPECFDEGELDVEKLRVALGEDLSPPKERYGLSWAGKADAIRAIQTPSTGTLAPRMEESVNFETTGHLFIEGDNLEVLKLLQKSYYGKIKMAYIDPPYNTGNEFIYPDNYREGLEDYLRYSGQIDDVGTKLTTNTETAGRYHSKWLNMMYPRLFLARNLLSDDGLLFASISDHEVFNLRAILNEIFGEENFVAQLVWKSRQFPDSRAVRRVSTDHEYILVYSRSTDSVFRGVKRDESKFRNPDDDERGPWMSRSILGLATAEQRPNLHYAIVDPDTGIEYLPPRNTGWRYAKERMQELIKEGSILFPTSPSGRPREKKYRADLQSEHIAFPTIIDDVFTAHGTAEIRELFGFQAFDFPKPTELLRRLVEQATGPDDIVLDFFAGSGTTAHAVWLQNRRDGGKRKSICIQLPETLDSKSELAKKGYATIADLAKDRFRRTLSAFNRETSQRNLLDGVELDEGFRAFALTSSNFKLWNATHAASDREGLAVQLRLFADHILPSRSQMGILYELILKVGLSLTVPIEEKSVGGKTVYSIAGGMLLICLTDEITQECLRGMIELEPERVVCLDPAFKGNDQLKTNTVLEMKSHGIEFRTV